MGGTLAPEATPGGGLTMTVSLPTAGSSADLPGQAADPAVLDHLDRWHVSDDAGEQGVPT